MAVWPVEEHGSPWPEREKTEIDRPWDIFIWGIPVRVSTVEQGGEWIPPLDVSETEDEVIITVELPGVDREDIDVTLRTRTLIVKGEKKEDQEEEKSYVNERTYGTFSRSIELPMEVKREQIRATFRHGIMRISIPKKKKAERKEIKIEVS